MAIKAAVQETTQGAYRAAEERLGAFADKAYEEGKSYAEDAVREQRNAFKRFCLSIINALRRGGDGLREDGYATVAGLVDDVATRAEEMTEEIDELDLRSTRERVEDFVRERPVMAYGTLALVGFLAANALQSASHHRHERRIADQSASTTGRSRSTSGQTRSSGQGATPRRKKPASSPRSSVSSRSSGSGSE